VRKLKFGVMVKGNVLETWQAECINALLKSGVAELELLILPENEGREKRSLKQKLLKHMKPSSLNKALFLLYNKICVRRRSRAHKKQDMGVVFSFVEKITCRTFKKGKYSEYFEAEDVDRIKSYKLDFILRFAFGIIRGDILQAAKYGVWSYHHDDETKYRGQPSCFWEIVKKDPVTGAILQKLTDRLDGGIVLRRGYFSTIKNYRKNLEQVHLGTADFCLQVCKQILTGNDKVFFAEPSRSDAPIYHQPGNLTMVRLFLIQSQDFFKKVFEKLFMSINWNIGIIPYSAEELIRRAKSGEITISDKNTRWLPRIRKLQFLADPILLSQENETLTVLVEKYDHRIKRGHIEELKFRFDGSLVGSRPVISEPWHMSYPYVVQEGENIYCIPETCAKGSLPLYRLQGGEWVFEKDILEDFAAVDATIFSYQNRWWLFATDKNDLPSEKLYIWHASSLLGSWISHALNPVVCDVRGARPGGRPFVVDGRLYRPAQDCSLSYGGALSINEIECLTPEVFSEKAVCSLKPDSHGKYREGVHTFMPFEGGVVIDGKRYEFSLLALYFKFLNKILKILK